MNARTFAVAIPAALLAALLLAGLGAYAWKTEDIGRRLHRECLSIFHEAARVATAMEPASQDEMKQLTAKEVAEIQATAAAVRHEIEQEFSVNRSKQIADCILHRGNTTSGGRPWLLWVKRFEKNVSTWEWADAGGDSVVFETRRACEQERFLNLHAQHKIWNEDMAGYEASRSAFGVSVRRKGARDIHFALGYHCLPDTIDPRRPRANAAP